MGELRPETRLALETLAQLRIGARCRAQDLQGDSAPEPRVARAVDLSHAAAAECGEHLVRSEPIASRKRHWGDYTASAPGPNACRARACARLAINPAPGPGLLLSPPWPSSSVPAAAPSALPCTCRTPASGTA